MTLGEPEVFRPLDRMRRNRNRSEYGTRELSASEVRRDIGKAQEIVAAVAALVGAR